MKMYDPKEVYKDICDTGNEINDLLIKKQQSIAFYDNEIKERREFIAKLYDILNKIYENNNSR
jgi:hypothetical protein